MNRLPGHITAIESHGSIAVVEVAVGAQRFTATLLGDAELVRQWKPEMLVSLLFKETEVALAKNLSGQISLRNRMPAIVTALEFGHLLTRVGLDMQGHAISSVITTRSARALQLAVGDMVEGLVKSNEMSVLQEQVA